MNRTVSRTVSKTPYSAQEKIIFIVPDEALQSGIMEDLLAQVTKRASLDVIINQRSPAELGV